MPTEANGTATARGQTTEEVERALIRCPAVQCATAQTAPVMPPRCEPAQVDVRQSFAIANDFAAPSLFCHQRGSLPALLHFHMFIPIPDGRDAQNGSGQARGIALVNLSMFALSSSPKWYVAEIISQDIVRAERNLAQQGFTCFCPRFRKTRRHARRVDQILAPVFPGYVFVRFDREQDPWYAINGTFGVKRLVGATSSRPQAMPEEVMQSLFARCESGVISSLVPHLRAGQQVRLIAGPLVDQLATIERLGDRDRVRVLLNILGGQVSATVALGDLAPA